LFYLKNMIFNHDTQELDSQTVNSNPNYYRLPQELTWTIVFISLLPFILNLLGFDFAAPEYKLDLANLSQLEAIDLSDSLHRTLSGSFIHTILEWSAFCAAIFTVVLAFSYFRIQKDVTTPVIALALFFAGVMDAFHTLAADRLIETVADNRNLIPFTWAICRLFNVIITMIGVSILLLSKPKKWQQSGVFIITISAFFAVLAYSIIHVSATSYHLPETMFPGSIITRPWDVFPLLLFLVSGLVLYPNFDRKYPSIFSHALIISVIPNAMTQVYMAFGSTQLFDNYFNIAHFLKIIAYLVPLAGLILDYIYTHRKLKKTNYELNLEVFERQQAVAALRDSENQLKDKNQQLQDSFAELQKTQTQLIQTEKMSSLGQMVAGIAHEINNPVNFIYGNIIHINDYIRDLLGLVNLYQEQYPEATPEIESEIEAIDLEFLEDDLPKMINSIKGGAERIREMVLSLRNFSRLDEAEVKNIDIHEGINSSLIILSNRTKKGVNIVKEYHDLPLVECYPAQLNQVWMNIISNALDVLEEKKEQDHSFHPSIIIRTEALEDQRIKITIEDNGLGLPSEIKAKIFDPFFTTKPIGKGTGLGLSICYQIIQKHQGTIDVVSQPGEGTTFMIFLPVQLSTVNPEKTDN
jgi:two-component system, NtrC family, sensor kinase